MRPRQPLPDEGYTPRSTKEELARYYAKFGKHPNYPFEDDKKTEDYGAGIYSALLSPLNEERGSAGARGLKADKDP